MLKHLPNNWIKLNKLILDNKVQQFINHHLNDDPTKLILKGASFPKIKIQEIVEQIISKKKCKKKLPTWFRRDIIYPNKLNIEQTSSEITARYKSNLVSGNHLIDITGGFGVDSYYFAKQMSVITHCEIDEELSNIVAYNFDKLNVNNVKLIAADGIDYLIKSSKKFDWIYADPSRRNDVKGKVFLLNDCLPDISKNLNLMFLYSDNILLKTSPLLDITSTINELEFVKTIHIVAVNNEVKELLFILRKGYIGELKINAVNILKNDKLNFESNYKSKAIATYSLPCKYLYEPNSAILKAGLFNDISYQFKIEKLHDNSHLYTSDELIVFPGRRFKIIDTSSYDKKKLRKIIPLGKANITVRNFPQTVTQIRKKIGFKEGGDFYLFFTTNNENKHMVLICKKI